MALLNEADAIYLGSTPADAVYLGAVLVWPPVSNVVMLDSNFIYEDAAAATLVGTLSTQGGLAPYTYELVEE